MCLNLSLPSSLVTKLQLGNAAPEAPASPQAVLTLPLGNHENIITPTVLILWPSVVRGY
jgi:hypothetical protein